MIEHEWRELLLDRLGQIDEKLDRLSGQIGRTRERLAVLEAWRGWLTAAMGVVAALATGLLQEVARRALGGGH